MYFQFVTGTDVTDATSLEHIWLLFQFKLTSTVDNKMDNSKHKIQYYIFQFLIEIFWLYGQRIKGISGIAAVTKILFELVYFYFVLL